MRRASLFDLGAEIVIRVRCGVLFVRWIGSPVRLRCFDWSALVLILGGELADLSTRVRVRAPA